MRKIRIWMAVVIFLCLGVTGCQNKGTEFEGARAWSHLEVLTSGEFEGRLPGTLGHDQAAKYIAEEFQKLGLQSYEESGSYFQGFSCLTPQMTRPPVFAIVDESNHVLESFVHREDYAECTKAFASGGTVRGVPVIFSGPESLESAPSILILTDSSLYTEENCRFFLERGVQAVILPTQKELRGVDRNQMLKSVYLGNNKAQFLSEGLVSLVVTEETMIKLLAASDQGKQVKIDLDLQFPSVEAKNVIGVVEGSDPDLKEEVILVTAHYDHVGMDPDGTIYPGSLDNGSGVAVLLELARHVSMQKPGRTLVFVAFDAEESGLQGSRYFVYHAGNHLLPLAHAKVINLDMIGSMEAVNLSIETYLGSDQEFAGEIDNQELAREIQAIAGRQNILLDIHGDSVASDHMSFVNRGVPAITFSHLATSRIHTPEDTLGNVSMARMEEVGNFLLPVLNQLANQKTGAYRAENFWGSRKLAVGFFIWTTLLVLLVGWKRKRKKHLGRHSSFPIITIFVSTSLMGMIVWGSQSSVETEVPASLALEPWNHVVEIDLPGVEMLKGHQAEEGLIFVATTDSGEEGYWLNAEGKQVRRLSGEEVVSLQAFESLDAEETDDQGRVHRIVSKTDEKGRYQLFYQWQNQLGQTSRPITLANLDENTEWTFAMDQGMGFVFFSDKQGINLIRFPLGTNRQSAVSCQSLVIHHASGARIRADQFRVLEENANRISIAMSGELGTGAQVIERLDFEQGKLARHGMLYETMEGSIDDLWASHLDGDAYLAWFDRREEEIKLISSNPYFGFSSLETQGIMGISRLIQAFVQGGIVMLTKAFWILPGLLLILLFALKPERAISAKLALFALVLNMGLQMIVFKMPNLFGVSYENVIVSLIFSVLVGGIVWIYGLETDKGSPIRLFFIFTVLNLFFLSLLYAPKLFENGVDRLNQTEFFGQEIKNQEQG